MAFSGRRVWLLSLLSLLPLLPLVPCLLLLLVLPLMTARGCRDEVVVQCRVRAGSHNDDDDAA